MAARFLALGIVLECAAGPLRSAGVDASALVVTGLVLIAVGILGLGKLR